MSDSEIPESVRRAFDVMCETARWAFPGLNLGLLACKDKKTGQPRYVIGRANKAAVNGNHEIAIEPMAVMLDEALLESIDFGGEVENVAGKPEVIEAFVSPEGFTPPEQGPLVPPGMSDDELRTEIEAVLSDMAKRHKTGPVVADGHEVQHQTLSGAAAWPFHPTKENKNG